MTWVLLWNPQEYDWEGHRFAKQYDEYRRSGALESRWSCGWVHARGDSGPRAGGRFFQFKVGRAAPGLVGAGHFIAPPKPSHGKFKGAPLAVIRYEYLADIRAPQSYVPRTALRVLTGDTLRYPASGMPIAPQIAARLELLLGLIRSVAAEAA